MNKPEEFFILKSCFFLIGLARIIPWTFFVTANDYWMYKFRNTSLTYYNSELRTDLQVEFSSSVSITLQVADLVSLILALAFGHKFKVNFKIIGSLTTILISFVILAIFIEIDTDSWQRGFFVMTMLFVALINAINSIFGMAMYSVVSNFSDAYLGPYLNGQGLAGVITSSLQIISLAVGMSTKVSAIIYFGCGIVINALALILTVITIKHPFYSRKMATFTDNQKGRMISLKETITVSKKIWPTIAIAALWILTVDPVHPSVTALVTSQNEGQDDWGDIFFVPTSCFLVPAVAELVGRTLATKFKTNISGPWWTIFTALRMFVFVPLIMVCNAKPRKYLPVVFPYDYQFILIMIFFAFSNGYLLNLCSIIIPRLVLPEELEDSYHIYMVATGILLGALSPLGLLFVKLL